MLQTQSAIPVTPDAALVAASNATINTSERSSVAPTDHQREAPTQIQTACVDLVCQLESRLTRAEKERTDGYLGEIVPIVEEFLQTASDFGEMHFHGDPLEALNRRIVEARECSRSLGKAVASFEWKALRRIIGRPSASEREVLKIHSELGTALVMVVVSALGPAIEMLGSNTKSAKEVLKIVRVFIAELQERW